MTDHGTDIFSYLDVPGMIVMAKMVVTTERIECPECQTEQDAKILRMDGAIWPMLVHACIQCGHVIHEIEWNTVAKERKP
jgi:ribosomal protein L37AE/L43A